MERPTPKLPELLAPAGNPERLRTALHYGADAVYVGLKAMSLRNYADNFSPAELKEACALAHGMGRRVYVTLNAFARDEDLQTLPQLLAARGFLCVTVEELFAVKGVEPACGTLYHRVREE